MEEKRLPHLSTKRIPAVAVVHVPRYVRCVQFRCARMKRGFYIHW